jgi:hypothetical protein
MYIGLHVKYPLSAWDYNKTWIFLTDFLKILKDKISWISVCWELRACLVDTRMDRRDKANSRFLATLRMHLTTVYNTWLLKRKG